MRRPLFASPALRFGILLAVLVFLGGCSSAPEIKRQQYAKLSSSKDFEEEYDVVWKAVLEAVSDYQIESKNAEAGDLATDWVYSTSNDKYVEYKVNGFPRKHYLQTRFRFRIKAARQIGSVKVTVDPIEEVERLRSDGSFEKWISAEEPDSSRAAELIRKIEVKILGRPV